MNTMHLPDCLCDACAEVRGAPYKAAMTARASPPRVWPVYRVWAPWDLAHATWREVWNGAHLLGWRIMCRFGWLQTQRRVRRNMRRMVGK